MNVIQPTHMYIYSNIVAHNFVGDSSAPLLQTLSVDRNIRGKSSEIDIFFATPQYKPLSTNSFDIIEINIRDASGKLLPFQRGHLIITLHFKPALSK